MLYEVITWTIKASLEWGTPFVLYWEMYNNEIQQETGNQVGYWLIDYKGKKQPIWYTHNNFYKESKAYVEDCLVSSGKLPTFDEFRRITSYNVCYTKLLRNSSLQHSSRKL